MRLIACLTTLLIAPAMHAQTIVLDDFDSNPNDEAGGPRELSSTINFNPYNQSSSFEVLTGFTLDDIAGAVVFNSGIGVEHTGIINWDNNGAGLNLDAAALGLVGFELDFLQIDQMFEIGILLETFGAANASASLTSKIGPALSPKTFSFSAGDFSFQENFDLSDVDSVTITFNSESMNTPSLDFILTEFRAVVPSPASAALLGLGGLVATRRRR
ncbi:MAG: VPLPA-CTERM sorting domain-containing protein [Phycisphaerales bacterium JB040]